MVIAYFSVLLNVLLYTTSWMNDNTHISRDSETFCTISW